MSQTLGKDTGHPTTAAERTSPPMSRRRFLAGSGALAGLAVLAACGDDDTRGGTGGTTTTARHERQTTGGDAEVATLAAGLEVLAVQTYQSLLDAATSRRLGAVPPAGAEYVRTAMAHHEAHRDGWNEVLRAAGRPEVTTPNARLRPTMDAELAKVRDFTGAARLALTLEEIAAATYLDAIPSLRSREVVKQAASIQAIDAKHVALLLYLLGRYPVPETFAAGDKAAKPA